MEYIDDGVGDTVGRAAPDAGVEDRISEADEALGDTAADSTDWTDELRTSTQPASPNNARSISGDLEERKRRGAGSDGLTDCAGTTEPYR